MDIRAAERWIIPVNEIVLRNMEEQEENFVVLNDVDFEQSETLTFSSYTVGASLDHTYVVYPSSPFTFTVLNWGGDWTKFQTLLKEWKSRKRVSSCAQDIFSEPSYMRIVGMGMSAIPFILLQLKAEAQFDEPDHWFPALWAITGENPVPPHSRGNLGEMATAWLDWGVARGFLNADTVGVSFPSSW